VDNLATGITKLEGTDKKFITGGKPIKTIMNNWIVITAICALVWPAESRAQYNYTTNNGTVTITGYTGIAANVNIPDKINGVTVAGIGSLAFSNSSVANVTIPSSVTNIGDEAFWECYSLTNITVAAGNANYVGLNGVLYDQTETVLIQFPDTPGTTAYTIPATVKSIGDGAFSYSFLASVSIPNSVTNIGQNAFNGCWRLTNLIIPASVIGIGDEAFAWCDDLTNISVATGNACYVSVGGVLYNQTETTLIQFPVGSAFTAYTIPATVKNIGDGAFGDSSLTAVTIPDSVTNIGCEAFNGCSELTRMTIPSRVVGIGDEAFGWCSCLTNITVAIGNANYMDVNGVLFDQAEATLIQFPAGAATSNYDIPVSVTNLGDGAFGGSGLTSITIPSNVRSIGDQVFAFCGSLANVAMSTNVTMIGDEEFEWCTNLTTMNIPNGVRNIGQGAFWDCSSLTTMTIPDSVTNIGDEAFSVCWNLRSVILSTNLVTIGDQVFAYCDNLTNVRMGSGVKSIGNSAFISCPSLAEVAIPDGVTNIGDDAFCACSTLARVRIPDSVTGMGDEAFGWCGLTNVTIGDGLTSIADSAFYDCDRLTTVTIPNNVQSIGDHAFEYCWFLGSVTTPNNLTNIGAHAFANCWELSSMAIPASVIAIGDAAFEECGGLTNISVAAGNAFYTSVDGVLYDKAETDLIHFPGGTGATSYSIPTTVKNIGDGAFSDGFLMSVTIPNGVTNIGKDAFNGCWLLPNLAIPASVTSIGDGAFEWCSSLTNLTVATGNADFASVDGVLFNQARTKLIQYPISRSGAMYLIPNSVTNIGFYAFGDCHLTNMVIPNSVISIGEGAFDNCSQLANVVVGDRVASLGDNAFCNCSRLTSVAIPDSVTSIGGSAFSVCGSLTTVTMPASVASIGESAFVSSGLTNAFFLGNAPTVAGRPGSSDEGLFSPNSGTVYHLPGTAGWGMTFGGWPVVEWNQGLPVITMAGAAGASVQSNGFSFTVASLPNTTLIVEACTNLAGPVWLPVATNAPTAGVLNFSDSQWTNMAQRFYRVRLE
jgi:hypothetical protein